MSGRPSSILNGWKSAILLLSFIVPLLHGTARATTAPPGLLPGDTYQFVFVTQAVINATSPDLSIYDAFAQNEALLNPALTGASTTSVSNRPFYRAQQKSAPERDPRRLCASSLKG
jgi:hypothetical protein